MRTEIRSLGGRASPPRVVASVAVLLVGMGVGRARADEAVPAPAGADATGTDGAGTDSASAPQPVSASAIAARRAARAVANTSALPCLVRATSAAAAIAFTPAGRTLEVWLVPFAAASTPTRVATLSRQPSSPVTAVALPGTEQVAVSVVRRLERDATWSATVFLVGPGRKSHVLLERAFAGGPLLATADRGVIAVREIAGPERTPSAAGLRRDTLEVVTAVETPDGVEVRPLSRQVGDALLLVGVKDHELFAYRVGGRDTERPPARQPSERRGAPSGELISIDLGTGAVRSVVPAMPPLARDFSFDPLSGTIWFAGLGPDVGVEEESGVAGKGTNAMGRDTARYALFGLDPATARLSVIVTGDSLAFLPRAWPGDRVAFRCQDGSNALCLAARPGRAGSGRSDRRVAPLIGNASGSAEVQLVTCTDGGELAFGVRRDPGRSLPTPFLWTVGDSAARDVRLPAGQVAFVGVVDLTTPASAATLPALAPAAH